MDPGELLCWAADALQLADSNTVLKLAEIPHKPVVLDCGSGLVKVGFTGEDAPRAVFPTAVGVAKYGAGMVRSSRHTVLCHIVSSAPSNAFTSRATSHVLQSRRLGLRTRSTMWVMRCSASGVGCASGIPSTKALWKTGMTWGGSGKHAGCIVAQSASVHLACWSQALGCNRLVLFSFCTCPGIQQPRASVDITCTAGTTLSLMSYVLCRTSIQ